MKYTIVKIGGIITQISKSTDVEGYTEGVLQSILPDLEYEIKKWKKKQREDWVKENNKRMLANLELLNKEDL